MRTLAGLGVLVLALAAGCDSDQPLQLAGQTADLVFSAPGGRLDEYLLYDIFEDNDFDAVADDINGDGVVDDADTSLFCLATGVTRSAQSLPWSYSVEIDVLRAGQTTAETIVSSLDPGVNLAEYDESSTDDFTPLGATTIMHAKGECSLNAAITCNPDSPNDFCGDNGAGPCVALGECDGDPSETCAPLPSDITDCLVPGARCDCTDPMLNSGTCGPDGRCTGFSGIYCEPGCSERGAGTTCIAASVSRRFVFDQPARRVTAGNRELMASQTNFLNDFDPVNWSSGVCPGEDLGDSGIGGQGQPFSLQLNKGDTMIVTGRRFTDIPPGLTFTSPGSSEPGISADLLVDGVGVVVQGETSTLQDGSQAISFSFTSR